MQLTNIFFSLMLATAVVAKDDDSSDVKEVNDRSLCREMAQLTHFVKLASNDTKIAAMTKNNATKIADFKAKASEASAKLTTMQSNATFVNLCNVIAADQTVKFECAKMRSLMKLKSLAANETAVTELTNGNATKAETFKAKAAEGQTKLTEMMTNATFVDACKAITAAKEQKAGTAEAAAAGTSASPSATPSAASSAGLVLNANSGFISTVLVLAAGMMML